MTFQEIKFALIVLAYTGAVWAYAWNCGYDARKKERADQESR